MRKSGKIISYLILVITFTVLMGFMAECESKKAVTGDPDANKAILLRAFELWNTGDLTIADEIFATDFVNHDPNDPNIIDLESYKGFIAATRNAFPDFHVAGKDTVDEGDKVASRWTIAGTHQGELLGIPPTGKQATWTGITIYRFAGGKIVEAWWMKDVLGLLQQLGVIPPMGREDFTWGVPSAVTGDPGDPETNKAIVRRWTEEFYNQWNIEVADELITTDYVHHDPGNPMTRDLEELKQWAPMLFIAFPDFHVTTEDLVAESDKVAKRYTITGTHKGEYMGIPPTDNQIVVTGIEIFRIADGKIVESWWSVDYLGMLQQLGVIPPPG
jgi:steroid delta-isomerase-like uncharacterized protein